MNLTVVGMLHALFSVSLTLYGYVFPKSKYDYFYILFLLGIYLGWTTHDGQCVISFAMKKDKKSTSVENDDILSMFGGKGKQYAELAMKIQAAFTFVGTYIVFHRNGIPMKLLAVMILYYYLTYLKNRIINYTFMVVFLASFLYYGWEALRKFNYV